MDMFNFPGNEGSRFWGAVVEVRSLTALPDQLVLSRTD
jgi:hypothetical protein